MTQALHPGPAGSSTADESAPSAGAHLVLDLQAAAARTATGVRRYGARIGSFRFLLAPDLTTELLPMQSPARLPLSPKELVGIINVRGTLAPLFDLTRLPPDSELDQPLSHDESEERMTLLVRAGQDAFALVIDGYLRTLVDLQPVSDPLPPLAPATLHRHVGRSWHGLGADWYEMNLAAFLEERAATQAPRHAPARVL